MRYALLIYADEAGWDARSDDERRSEYRRYEEFGGWLTERGWLRGGDQLAGSSSATCVRVEGGRTAATDGPFAETKEQLGGFYLIECDNLDQAIEAASRIPAAEHGTIEVRPITGGG
jgi:hypothetical protein